MVHKGNMRRSAKLIDGKAVAAALRVAIKSNVQQLTATHGRVRTAVLLSSVWCLYHCNN